MDKPRVSQGLLIVIVIAAAMMASLSGPHVQQPATAAGEPPPIEELIPQGERADNNFTIRVLHGGSVADMTMEQYLIGVVAAEMPASFEIEALKAQAVAARTNAMYNITVMQKTRHPEAHVCTDASCCTAYKGDGRLREEWGAGYIRSIDRIISAVIETDGICMYYEDMPVLAVFHSSSAGQTEASGNVWLNDLPYLLCVSSPETAENVPGYISAVTVPFDEFASKVLDAYPDAVFGADVKSWIKDTTFTASGRVNSLSVGGITIKGTILRSMLGLRSTAVTIEFVGDSIVFTTTGFGHGVGMSQYGANVMAVSGNDYTEILSHYYTGVSLVALRTEL